MRYLLLSAMMICAVLSLYGQPEDCRCDPEDQGARLVSNLTCIVLPAAEVRSPDEGPYYQWRYGKVILNSGEIIPGVFMHYDGLNDQLIIDSKDPSVKLAVEKYTIQGFDMDSLNFDHQFSFRRLKVKGKHPADYQDMFLQVLISGRNTLYSYRKLAKTLQENTIIRNYVYFIKKEDGSMVSFVKPSRKILIGLFPEKKDAYRVRLRKEHLHVRNEEQLIIAIGVLNSL